MRSIGPALMGGRIADLAIHPSDPSTWYVGVGSGGVWKTANNGITWSPLFDDETSYSIGCVRIDPNRPEVVWVGTGEAVSGRHVAWGDGVYKSIDAGNSWTRMGLEHSEHVSDILIDPRDGNTVYVAAEGPLWSSGGERGLYKTTDGGASWDRVLHVDDDTGVSSAVFAPDDPDTIYAATYQRRRRVWSFLGGGPGSGIHVSNDAGSTFAPDRRGSTEGRDGKHRSGGHARPTPSLVYATIEARREGSAASTGRRPRRELGAAQRLHLRRHRSALLPGDVRIADRRRLGSTRSTCSSMSPPTAARRSAPGDGHEQAQRQPRRVDRSRRRRHLIVGCDAGLYETFDEGEAWRHVPNLPDLAVLPGRRRQLGAVLQRARRRPGPRHPVAGRRERCHVDGVRNQDWMVVLGSDGYQVAFDPDDDRISYLEWQSGNVHAPRPSTMELQDIQPQPAPGDPPERWNWDTPILISPHAPRRSTSRRNGCGAATTEASRGRRSAPTSRPTGTATSCPTFDRVTSVDSVFDHRAMSLYCTITDVAESPIERGPALRRHRRRADPRDRRRRDDLAAHDPARRVAEYRVHQRHRGVAARRRRRDRRRRRPQERRLHALPVREP